MERDTQRAFSKKQAQRNVNEGARARETERERACGRVSATDLRSQTQAQKLGTWSHVQIKGGSSIPRGSKDPMPISDTM